MTKNFLASVDFWKIACSVITISSVFIAILTPPIRFFIKSIIKEIFNKFSSANEYGRRSDDEYKAPVVPSNTIPLCGHTCTSSQRLNVVEVRITELGNRINCLETSIPDITEGIEDMSKELRVKLSHEEFKSYKDEMRKTVSDISRVSYKTSEDVAVIKESLDNNKKESVILRHELSKCNEGIARLSAQIEIILSTRFNSRM